MNLQQRIDRLNEEIAKEEAEEQARKKLELDRQKVEWMRQFLTLIDPEIIPELAISFCSEDSPRDGFYVEYGDLGLRVHLNAHYEHMEIDGLYLSPTNLIVDCNNNGAGEEDFTECLVRAFRSAQRRR